jgi:opacity protein-like surface antigen
MKKITLFVVFAALTMLAAGSAVAQDPPAGGGGGGGGGGEATTYDFDDDLVTGDLVRPDGELLNVRRRGQRNSLIRIREHFIPEMLKSVENL